MGSKTEGWKVGRSLFSYRDVFNGSNKEFPYEAEHLWAARLFTSFVKRKEDERLAGKTKRPKPEAGWRFDLAPAAKGAFCGVLATGATKDVRRWV